MGNTFLNVVLTILESVSPPGKQIMAHHVVGRVLELHLVVVVKRVAVLKMEVLLRYKSVTE